MSYQTEAPDYRSAYRDFDYEDQYEDQDWDDRVGGMLSENKVPLALIGLGLGWMLLSSARHTDTYQEYSHRLDERTRGWRQQASRAVDDYRHRAEHAYEDYRHRAEDMVQRGRERMGGSQGSSQGSSTAAGYDRIADYDSRDEQGWGGNWRQSARERYSDVADRARGMGGMTARRARQVNQSLWDMVDEYPVAAGLMGLALGAAIGASLPSTEMEDEWVGEYRDHAVDELWERGRDTAHQAADVAREAVSAGAEAASETAQRRAEEQGLTSGNGGSSSSDRNTQSARGGSSGAGTA